MESYQKDVIEGISAIKRMQFELAKTAEKQIELLERLVGLEHDTKECNSSLKQLNTRLTVVEEEVDKWAVMRKVIAWVGPTGLVATIWILLEVHDMLAHGSI